MPDFGNPANVAMFIGLCISFIKSISAILLTFVAEWKLTRDIRSYPDTPVKEHIRTLDTFILIIETIVLLARALRGHLADDPGFRQDHDNPLHKV
jgi:hypothetical protein